MCQRMCVFAQYVMEARSNTKFNCVFDFLIKHSSDTSSSIYIRLHVLCITSVYMYFVLHQSTCILYCIRLHVLCIASDYMCFVLHQSTCTLYCISLHVLCIASDYMYFVLHQTTCALYCIRLHVLCIASDYMYFVLRQSKCTLNFELLSNRSRFSIPYTVKQLHASYSLM
jgi:hypothetical protein